MEVQIRYLKAGYVLETNRIPCNEAQFLGWYLPGKFEGYSIISMTWIHKGETHKLIFGG